MKAWEVYNKLDWCQTEKYIYKNGQAGIEVWSDVVSCCIWGAMCIAYPNYNARSVSLRKFKLKTGKYPAEINDYVLKNKAEAQALLKKLDI